MYLEACKLGFKNIPLFLPSSLPSFFLPSVFFLDPYHHYYYCFFDAYTPWGHLCWRQIHGDLLKVADAMLQRVLSLGVGTDFDCLL